MAPPGVQKTTCMTLLSAINSLLVQPGPRYMDFLDHWTAFSIECHFRELVEECQRLNGTGKTDITETSETSETDSAPPLNYYDITETSETDSLPPLN